jgi:hypothetical protein
LVIEVKPVSILNRPQRDWDSFLDETEHSRSKSPLRKLLWIVIPIGILVASYLLGKILTG